MCPTAIRLDQVQLFGKNPIGPAWCAPANVPSGMKVEAESDERVGTPSHLCLANTIGRQPGVDAA